MNTSSPGETERVTTTTKSPLLSNSHVAFGAVEWLNMSATGTQQCTVLFSGELVLPKVLVSSRRCDCTKRSRSKAGPRTSADTRRVIVWCASRYAASFHSALCTSGDGFKTLRALLSSISLLCGMYRKSALNCIPSSRSNHVASCQPSFPSSRHGPRACRLWSRFATKDTTSGHSIRTSSEAKADTASTSSSPSSCMATRVS
mmetsp:Transcript_20247/g.36117  ORF Transcript_20247/g.36117 Transcript_20247/m.36117 type:complete len:202 (+) Transcript_20247:276-881(+)